jgi:hypothetical protein
MSLKKILKEQEEIKRIKNEIFNQEKEKKKVDDEIMLGI